MKKKLDEVWLRDGRSRHSLAYHLRHAFLLFQVQPLVSKAILPWFGGCPAVWTTCMLFFQVVLFRLCVCPSSATLAERRASGRFTWPWSSWRCHCCRSCRGRRGSRPAGPIHVADPVLLTGTVGCPISCFRRRARWSRRGLRGARAITLSALCVVELRIAGGPVSYPFFFEPAFDVPPRSRAFGRAAFVLYGQRRRAAALMCRVRTSPVAHRQKRCGECRPRGVSDERLAITDRVGPFSVAGTAGLRVADASWRPRITCVKTWRQCRFFG